MVGIGLSSKLDAPDRHRLGLVIVIVVEDTRGWISAGRRRKQLIVLLSPSPLSGPLKFA